MKNRVNTRDGSQRFVAMTERLDDERPVVSIQGAVDHATAPTLERALAGVATTRASEVIVDLDGCSFRDAHGFVVLIIAKERLERRDRGLALVLSDPAMLNVFKIMHLDELFEIYPSLGAIDNRDGHGDAVSARAQVGDARGVT
jgi:anti-sigma B factor antagonist